MAATATQIHQLYVAYFNRAADPAGLAYWTSTGASAEAIAAAFGSSKQVETAANFKLINDPTLVNSVTGRSEFIDQVYNNLFGHKPDAAGKDYWDAQLAQGKVSVSQFIVAVINGAQGDDAAIVANKAAVSASFVEQATAAGIVLSGATYADGSPVFAASLKGVLAGVTENAATVQIGQAQAAQAVAAGTTTGLVDVDVLMVANKTVSLNGTAGNDVFSADGLTNMASDAKIDAGAGVDTLILKAATSHATQFYNFESVKLAADTAAANFDATAFTNSKIASVTVDKALGTNAIAITGNNGLVVNTEKDATTITSLTLKAANATVNDVLGDNALVNTIGGNVTINSGATVNKFSNLIVNNKDADATYHFNGFDTVSLAGSKAAAVTLDANTKVFAAGSYAGDITVGSGAATTSLVTGSGNDKIQVAGGSSNIAVDAGNGNDLITVTTLVANTSSIKLSGGAGTDAFSFTTGSAGSHVTIADFAVGDSLIVADATAGIAKAAAFATAPADFAAALLTVQTDVNAAGINHAQWFQFGGDTYVVGSGAVNTAGPAGLADDLVIKLAGTVDLTNAIHAA